VTIDSVAIDNLQRSPCPFVTERDPEPQLEEYASYGTLCASRCFRGLAGLCPTFSRFPMGFYASTWRCPQVRRTRKSAADCAQRGESKKKPECPRL